MWGDMGRYALGLELADVEDVVEGVEGNLDHLGLGHGEQVAQRRDAALRHQVRNLFGAAAAACVAERPSCQEGRERREGETT